MEGRNRVMNHFKRVLALAAILPIGLIAGCSENDDRPSSSLEISSAGTVKGIGVGSTSGQVRKTFGEPVVDRVYYPVEPANADPDVDHKWSEITGPYHYGPGGPPDRVQRTLIYDDISFYTVRGKVIGYLMTGAGSGTAEGLGIGDSLSQVEETYPDASCEAAWKGETTSVREAHCDLGLEETSLNVTGDPIESFTVGADGFTY